jgi:hypothetical protein
MALKDLVVSSDDLLEETVEEVVKKHFKYSDKGEVLITNKDFWRLNGEVRILRYLAAVSGRKFLGIDNPELGLNNAQLSKGLNMNVNSVRGNLSILRKSGLIETEKGVNRITTQGLHELLEEDKKHD